MKQQFVETKGPTKLRLLAIAAAVGAIFIAGPLISAQETREKDNKDKRVRKAIQIINKEAQPKKRASLTEDRRFKNFAVSESRYVEELLSNARSLLANKDWVGGVSQLQEIMDRYANKVHSTQDGSVIYRSYRERCLDELRGLPENGLAAYRGQFDDRALELYHRGRAERDPAYLREIVKRFPLTSHADEAMLTLGDLFQERGELEESLYYYQRVIEEEAGSTSDVPSTYLRAAYCVQELGRVEPLSRILSLLGKRHPGSSVSYRGEQRATEEIIQEWMERTQKEALARRSAWTMIGGNPRRNERMSNPRDDSPIQWDLDLPDIEFGTIRRRGQSPRDQTHHTEQVFPFHPVLGQNSMILHNGYRVQALDLYVGRKKWEFEPGERERSERTDSRQIFSGVLKDGVYFANLEVSATDFSWDWVHGPVRVPIPMRKLFALDADTGKKIWSHTDPPPSSLSQARFLNKLSISSPPLVTRDTVYAVGSLFEGKIHCYVCAFDARDGSMLWNTLICTGQQELNMFGRPLLEHVASTLAEDRGTLYFSTNLGLMAAVDARLGTVRWISEYRSIEMPLNQGFNFLVRKFVFANCPPIVTDDRVICAPMDSRSVYCFDTVTGETLWSKSQGEIQGGFNSVLGEQDGLVLVAGRSITALDLESGRKTWSHPLAPRAKSAGLGGITQDLVLCPTRGGLTAVNLKTGRLRNKVFDGTQLNGGNLVVTDRFLVHAGTRILSVCYRWAEVFEALQERIERTPLDPLVYLEVGNIFRQGKEFNKAADHYQKAIRLTSEDPVVSTEIIVRATAGLYATYMSLGDQAWRTRKLSNALKWYTNAKKYAYDDLTLLENLLAFVRYYEATGNSKKLLATYGTLFEELPTFSYSFEKDSDSISAGLYALLSTAEYHMRLGQPEKATATFQQIIRCYPFESYRDQSAHQFATEQIDGLVSRHGASVYATFETRAQARFEASKRSADIVELRNVVHEYPNSTVVQPSLVLLADLLIDAKQELEAVEVLRRFLITFPRSELTSHVLEKLGVCYERSGHPAAGRRISARLNYDRFPKSENPRRLPQLTTPLPSLWKKSYSRSIGLNLLRITDLSSTPVIDRFFFYTNRTLSCASIETGELLWSATLGGRLGPHATLIDRLLFVNSSQTIAALDPLSGDIVWELIPAGLVRDFKVIPGTALAVIENRDQPGYYSMRAIEALNGTPLWERNFKGSLFGQLILTENFVSTYSTKPVTMIAIDPFDNRKQFEYALGPQYMQPTPLSKNRIFIFKQNETRVLDLDRKQVRWEAKTPREKEHVKHAIALDENVAVLLAERNEHFYLALLDGETGMARWRTKLPPGHILPARSQEMIGGRLTFLNRRTEDLSYRLLAVDNSNGEIVWETPPFEGKTLPRRVLETDKHVIVERNFIEDNELRNVVLVCDKTTGEVQWEWQHRGSYTSEVVLVGNTLLILLANQVEAYGESPARSNR